MKTSSCKLPPSFLRRGITTLPTLAAALLLAGAGSGVAEVMEDFESSPAVMVENNSHEETQAAIVEDPAKPDSRAMKLSWKAHSGTHVAGSLATPGVALIQEPGVYEITAKVNLEQCPLEMKSLALRVVDGGNETFQYSAPIEKAGEPGWTEMKWTINTNEPLPGQSKSWGDRVDGAMDFPVRFFGFAAGLPDWKTEGGAFLFDDIAVTKISD